jgi:glycerophosphoryl diester phosphodiesterase
VSAVGRPLVIGHRGAPGYVPEHSRASYELAIRSGADAVEPDIVLSRDGVAIVSHEHELSATTDVAGHAAFAGRRRHRVVDGVAREGWFAEDFDWDELASLQRRERWPHLRPASAAQAGGGLLSLAQLFEIVADGEAETGRDLVMVLELKHAAHLRALGHDLEAVVLDEIRRDAELRGRRRRTIVESFELDALHRLRGLGFAGEVAALVESGTPLAALLADERIERMLEGMDLVSVDKDLLLAAPDGAAAAVDRLRGRGLGVLAWTLRPENAFLCPAQRRGTDPAAHGDYAAEWDEVFAAGLVGVFVDHPELAVQRLATGDGS